MTPNSDVEHFLGLAKGGRWAKSALQALYSEYARKFLVHLRRKGFTPEQSEDIVQDVFVNVARLGERAATIEHPRAYLWRALENAAMDVHRARAKREIPESEVISSGDPDDPVTIEDLAPLEPEDGENAGLIDCFQKALLVFLKQNPEGARAINLAVVEELSGQELADALGRTYGATREFLSQCRKKFTALLNDLCHDYVPESMRTP